ncbi:MULTISPECIES: hypothetical protein [Flavobacterium]|uniref:ATPase AAA-type core domain-containing protein n=1 Tax=Flavobacterium hankyongi TaxID=1176532 RepID=A0ABP9A4A3_9FLAO|nr:hypothetical protein [Flavobacterium sp. N1846]
MNFKLLSIRPLDGCDYKFLKNLEENRIYKFYNEYDFLDEKGNEIKEFGSKNYKIVKNIRYTNTLPDDLYNLNNTKINVSAIVGKNGSGKSALMEILYGAIYNFSIKNINGFNAKYKKNNIACELFFCIHYKGIQNEEIIDYYVLKNKSNSIQIFSLNGASLENFNDFLFYTVASNYSLYGLNSDLIGPWIENLFHKNDGYQVPIVLNPMRTSGIINVNREYEFAKDRLLSNILNSKEIDKNSRFVLQNKKVNRISLKLKEKKIKLYHKDRTNKNEYLKKYLKSIFNSFKISEFEKDIDEFKIDEIIDSQNEVINYCTDYLLYKLKKISKNYSKEGTRFKVINYENGESVEMFLNNIRQNDLGSHITFKIRRLLNFLKYDFYEKKILIEYNDNDIDLLSKKIFDFRKKQIEMYKSKVIDSYKKESLNITYPFFLLTNMTLIPPSIYDVDYEFEDGGHFSLLSSGETQKIFSINTIFYHLINLNSKHNNYLFNDDIETKIRYEIESKKDIKYQFVNLILDEIELYFHPQMQKEYLNDILYKIDTTYLNGIKSINILFITHSPFILSDIPKQNVLFLDNGKPQNFEKMNTFGANIADLLIDSFFFGENENKLLIGDFAKMKINETIEWINEEKIKKLNKSYNKPNDALKKFHKGIIDLIDEPLMKYKLNEMFNEVIMDFSRADVLKNKIEEMQLELDSLNKIKK